MSTYRKIGRASYWDSFEASLHESATGTDATMTKRGVYAELIANAPRYGDVLEGWSGYSVTDVTTDRRPGQMGVQTIKLSGLDDSSSSASPSAVSRKFNLTWREINVGLFDGYYKAFGSDVNVALLQCWMVEPDASLKVAYKTNVPELYGTTGMYSCKYTETDLTGGTLDIAKRMLAGETSYKIAMPVMSIVERFVREPIHVVLPIVSTTATLITRFPRIVNNTINSRGRSSAPSAKYWPVGPSSVPYTWICLGRSIQDGDKNWTVTWEWQGALPPTGVLGVVWSSTVPVPAGGWSFDPLYYPSASVPPAGSVRQASGR